MGNFFDPSGTPQTRTAYLDNLPLYTANRGLVTALDEARVFAQSDKYFFQGYAYPSSQSTIFTARETKSGVITVIPLTYIINITAECFAVNPEEETSNLGISIRIYDKGAKSESVINGQFVKGNMVGGKFRNASTSATNRHKGQYWLRAPMIVLIPGALQLEITNMSSISVNAQILLGCGVPLNAQSMGETTIHKNVQG